jgi:hypothetical protein
MPAAVLWLPAPTVSRMELRIPRRRNNMSSSKDANLINSWRQRGDLHSPAPVSLLLTWGRSI